MARAPIATNAADPEATTPAAVDPQDGAKSGLGPNLSDETATKAWLQELFRNLVKLEIKTEKIDDNNQKFIHTKIDLLQGDITTRIHKEFLQGVDVYEFHKEQVQKAENIIANNVKTVKTMAESLFDLFF